MFSTTFLKHFHFPQTLSLSSNTFNFLKHFHFPQNFHFHQTISTQVADDRDIVIEAPADIVQQNADDSNLIEAEEAPKRDLNIEQPELKELIEEKIAKEENAEEEQRQDEAEKVVDADVDTHEGEDAEEKEVVEEKKAEEKEKEAEKDEAAKVEKKDLDAKIEVAAAQKNDDQPALAPPMVRTSLIKQDKIKIVV